MAVSGAVQLHVRLAYNLYRVQFFIASRLLVSLLLSNIFQNRQITSIDIKNQRLVLRQKGLYQFFVEKV